ncbi:uncharacterized protein Dwil_GK12361 [Drosophila willistoni]|uniref:Transmembrane protein n=2 Tax=Drosophila willistoni TaxID=7260 RepID=B4N6Q6_DROWI|nr:uncharacterized protein LOC6646382 isoform X1 [Drosophila willistoni]EDW80045.1 uncharacterized protein Dwil_GK12361 [Drosophila willistoni]
MGDGYLVLCSYCIAVLDLASALLFAIVSGMVYAKHGHWTSMAALVFTILWICLIIMLLLGIYWRRVSFVRYWLLFTCLGILLDGFLLLYGLTLAISVNWEGIKITVLPFVGLAVEMTFVYIIYIFYLHLKDLDEAKRVQGGAEYDYQEQNNEQYELKELDKKDNLQHIKKLIEEHNDEEKAMLKEMQHNLSADWV